MNSSKLQGFVKILLYDTFVIHFLYNSISSKLGEDMKIKMLKEIQQMTLTLFQMRTPEEFIQQFSGLLSKFT